MTDQYARRPDLRNFSIPFIYGLASANFLAVTQFAPAIQFKFNWKIVEKANSLSEVSQVLGFLGVIIMSASIPILLGYAVYCELIVKQQKRTPKPNPLALSLVFTFGISGIALALFAFHPAFGIAFASGMVAAIIFIICAARIKPRSSRMLRRIV